MRKILAAILIVSLLLNVIGVFWGAPHDFHPDEAVITSLQIVTDFAKQKVHSANLFRYHVLTVLAPYYVFLKMTGAALPSAWGTASDEFRTVALVLSRLISALYGVGTVWLLYLLGKEIWRERTGLVCALVGATNLGIANIAHFATFDMTAVFFGTVTLFFAIRYVKRESQNDLIFATCAAIVTVSTKYAYALFMIIVLLSFIIAKSSMRSRLAHIWKPLIIGNVLFCVLNVHLFFFTEKLASEFAWHFAYNAGSIAADYALNDRLPALTMVFNLLNAFNPIGFIVAMIALVLGIYERRNPAVQVLYLWLAIFIVFFSFAFEIAPLRWTLPIIIILCLFMGRLLARCPIWLVSIVALAGMSYVMTADVMMIHDTRIQAEEWINANIPADKTIEMNWGHTMFPFVADTHTVNVIPLLGQMDYAGLTANLSNRRPDYIVLSSLHYDRFLHANQYPELMDPIFEAVAPFRSRNPTLTRYFSELMEGRLGYQEVATFRRPVVLPSPEFVAPTIIILKRTE